MADFKKFGGNKGRVGNTFNRGSGGRPSFGGGKQDFRGGDRGEREMFKATCAECGRPCEVPFRPSGDRPVYCKDCFQAMGGPAAQNRGDRNGQGGRDSRAPFEPFQRREAPTRPQIQGSGEDKRLDDLKIQLATAISKLDKLINILGSTTHSTPKAMANTKTLHDTLAGMKILPTPKKETAKTKTPKKKTYAKKK